MPRTTIDIDGPILRDLKRCSESTVRVLDTRDADFRRFDFLDVRDPFA